MMAATRMRLSSARLILPAALWQHVYVVPSPRKHFSPVGLEVSPSLHDCASPVPAQQSPPLELQRSSSHSPLARTLAVWLQHWYTQPRPLEHSVVVLTGVRSSLHFMVSSPKFLAEQQSFPMLDLQASSSHWPASTAYVPARRASSASRASCRASMARFRFRVGDQAQTFCSFSRVQGGERVRRRHMIPSLFQDFPLK
jgi:hypothetical protein